LSKTSFIVVHLLFCFTT